MTKTTTHLTHIALAKILMKGHDCLTSYNAFEMTIHQHFDDQFVLVFTAKDHMEGYNDFIIDLHITDTFEEMVAWLSNSRVSTRRINTLISEHTVAEELAIELANEVEDHVIEMGLLPLNNNKVRDWNNAIIEPGSFIELWAEDVIHYGNCSFYTPTMARVKQYRKLWDKYLKS